MTTTPFAVKCGNCQGYHISADAVRACYFPPRPVTPPVAAVAQSALIVERPTQRQLDYITDLGGDPVLAMKLTRKGASLHIDRLKREAKQVSNHITEAPNRTSTKVPLALLKMVDDGYYATRLDSSQAHTFFRVSRPKPRRGAKFGGCLKVQTQHGDDLKLAMVVWPDGKVTVYNKSIEDQLLLVVVDQRGAALEYAAVIGRCMRCGCPLTDERSRWFGIGPECEKHWTWVIPEIEDTKGLFRHGWEG